MTERRQACTENAKTLIGQVQKSMGLTMQQFQRSSADSQFASQVKSRWNEAVDDLTLKRFWAHHDTDDVAYICPKEHIPTKVRVDVNHLRLRVYSRIDQKKPCPYTTENMSFMKEINRLHKVYAEETESPEKYTEYLDGLIPDYIRRIPDVYQAYIGRFPQPSLSYQWSLAEQQGFTDSQAAKKWNRGSQFPVPCEPTTSQKQDK